MIKRGKRGAGAEGPAGAATTADRVQDRLRGDILSGALKPGARITVEELAARYDVSQMPVREAIRVLSGEGVIETSPHRGARIVAVDAAFIRNVYDMREALEGMLAERCAERAGKADVARLRALIAAHAAAVERSDLGQVVLLDRQLHLLVAEIAANPLACRAITIGRGLIEALRMRTGFSAPRLARIVHEHEALVRAVEARDSRTAGLVARLHVVGARDDLVQALAAES
ncbi:GntR family transcriptional regulator [Falsiroseomonas sp.]|uniref:GntR family transcriptional regulator n=1 Tax=Falsiroseomonas sp. TaxID=2870721 RepID=UPI0035632033